MITVLNLLLFTTANSLLAASLGSNYPFLEPPSSYSVTQPIQISQHHKSSYNNQRSESSSSYACSSSEGELAYTPPNRSFNTYNQSPITFEHPEFKTRIHCPAPPKRSHMPKEDRPTLTQCIQSEYIQQEITSPPQNSEFLTNSQELRRRMAQERKESLDRLIKEKKKRERRIKKERALRDELRQSGTYSTSAPSMYSVPSPHFMHPSPGRDTNTYNTLPTEQQRFISKKSHSAPNSMEIRTNPSPQHAISTSSRSALKSSTERARKAASSYQKSQRPPLSRSNSLDNIRKRVPNLTAQFLNLFKLMSDPLTLEAHNNPNGIKQSIEHKGYIISAHITIQKKNT